MIVTVVGSGSLVPSARRSTPALALQGAGLQATLDGGSGTLHRQAELGIDFRLTDTLLFTHVHPDHTLDLLHFLFASKYTPGFIRSRPIRVVGPHGFRVFLEQLREGMREWTDGGKTRYEVVEVGTGDSLRVGAWDVEAVELYHSVTNVGYRFRTQRGTGFAFTGDTGWGKRLLDLARGVDLLVTECSGDEAHPAEGHLTAPEVGRLAAAAGVKQVVLTHLYPLADDRVRLAEIARYYGGPVLLASDGDRFEV